MVETHEEITQLEIHGTIAYTISHSRNKSHFRERLLVSTVYIRAREAMISLQIYKHPQTVVEMHETILSVASDAIIVQVFAKLLIAEKCTCFPARIEAVAETGRNYDTDMIFLIYEVVMVCLTESDIIPAVKPRSSLLFCANALHANNAAIANNKILFMIYIIEGFIIRFQFILLPIL